MTFNPKSLFEKMEDRAELYPEAACDEKQLVVQWELTGVGFGQLLFSVCEDGSIHCDNECMSRKTCKKILLLFAESGVYGERWPPLLARFDTPGTRTREQVIDALLDAATPRHLTDDWRLE